ncbi:MAG: putative quorum-sensing-regulated virulence factor [Gammaproteobacteria bacterium]
MSDSETVMPFGKHKGKTIEDLPSSYLHWLAENCEDEDICAAADEEYRWRSDNNAHESEISNSKRTED